MKRVFLLAFLLLGINVLCFARQGGLYSSKTILNEIFKSTNPAITIIIQDENGRAAQIDAATWAQVIVSYEHHEIHGGSHYFYQDYVTLGSGADIVFAAQTPDTTKWSHLVWEIEAQGLFIFQIYEGASVTFDGTDITTVFNNNRNSANTSNWVNFEYDPTVISSGTRLGGVQVGDASNPVTGIPGGGDRDREVILKQNTTYLFIIESGVADNVITYRAEWYEHTDKE